MVHQTKRRRCKRFHPPTLREAKNEFENYGIITSYNGGSGRFTTVQTYSNDGKIVELRQVRMKGSITPPKCRQRIMLGSYVLLEYGEIALIYKDSSLIPANIVQALETAAGEVDSVARGGKKQDVEDVSDFSEVSSSDDEEEETTNPDFI